MKRLLLTAMICALEVAAAPSVAPARAPSSPSSAVSSESVRLERDLQQLSWRQFRTVIEAVPRLKAAVDAYGPLGWQFVEANYRQYSWRKNIDKLDDAQKKQLAGHIERARRMR